MKIRDVKIAKQLNIVQITIIILVLIMGITSYLSTRYLFTKVETSYKHPIVVKDTISSIKYDVFQIRMLIEEAVLTDGIDEIKNIRIKVNVLYGEVATGIGILRSAYLGPLSDVERLNELILQDAVKREEVFKLLLEGNKDAASEYIRIDQSTGVITVEIMDSIKAIETFSTKKAQELYTDSLKYKNRTSVLLIILSLGIIIFVSIVLYILQNNILPPINQLKDALDHFKQGNMEVRNLNTSNNELGLISKSFNQMTERIEKDSYEKVNKAAELLAAQVEITSQAELIRVQAAYHIEKQLFQATLASIGDAVISCDINGCIIFMNKVAESLTGWKQEEAIGQKIEDVFLIANELTYEKSDNIIEKVILNGETAELENHTVLIRKDGVKIPIEDSAAPIFQENSKIVGVVLVFRDVTDMREKLKSIEYLSYHDELTGLYNRRFYEEEVKRLDTERNLPLTIVMGDVNGLKLVNDSLGHLAGDELLSKIAYILKRGSRADDIIARLGGDEFIIVLPNTSMAEASRIVNRIKTLASKETVYKLPVSISFGYGTKKEKTQDIQEVFITAETNMYKQKLTESANMRSKQLISL